MKTSNSFYLISKSLDKEFKGKYNLLRQLVEYMELYSLWNFHNKLQQDNSFFCSDNFISKKLGFSRCTVIRNRKELKEKGYIDFYSKQKEGTATYILINLKKIDEIQNSDNKEFINDFETQKIDETPVVAKNATVAEKNSETESVGYNLKPADNKEKSSDLALVENKESYKDKIQKAWNRVAEKHGLAKIMLVSDVRLKKFKTALKFFNCDEKTFFQNIHQSLLESNFLKGIGKDWKADFDFFITTSRAIKAFEGAYKDNENKFMQKLQNPDTMSFKEAERLRRDAQLQELKARCQRQEEEEKQKLIS